MLILRGLAVLTALAHTLAAAQIFASSTKTEASTLDTRSQNGAKIAPLIQSIPKTKVSNSVKLDRLTRRLKKKYGSGTAVQAETLEKDSLLKRTNTWSIDSAALPTATSSAGIDEDGTDYSYFAQVSVGSQNEAMYLLLDTGASTTWVMGSSCTSPACLIHNTFNPASSKTNAPSDISFSVAYGSGSTTGAFSTDNFVLAGITLNMTFGIANFTSNDFSSFPMDGILGLSQANGSTPNFIQTLTTQGHLATNVFGISLSRALDGPNTGEISFGAPDTSKYIGQLSYTPTQAQSNGDWIIPMDAIAFGTQDSHLTGKVAYLDTGTTFIFGPPADVSTLHALIPGSATTDQLTYTVPCTTTEPIVLAFSGVSYSISSKDWVGPAVNGVCTSNVYGQNIVGDNGWLLGDTFLKNVYSLYDVGGSRVGLAPSIGSSAVASGTTAGASIVASATGKASTTVTGPVSTSGVSGAPVTTNSGAVVATAVLAPEGSSVPGATTTHVAPSSSSSASPSGKSTNSGVGLSVCIGSWGIMAGVAVVLGL